ncbi:phasin family protein [Methylobrevis pamukkalensis]|uniref:Phasin protein n=1 Tax=Methylobrevis pamukkalensis TaxID=1439726 RepID=A0A1E3GXX4_9HYPH|nr:phasin family protein [Methylobrevis pamukkalensis]ODN68929.1 Phasin protein [Methylobrevis pamukkalensis]
MDAVSKGVQAIAVEATDYSKKSAEDTSKLVEKMMGCKSFESVMELQSDFVKKSYEGAVSQMTKMTRCISISPRTPPSPTRHHRQIREVS